MIGGRKVAAGGGGDLRPPRELGWVDDKVGDLVLSCPRPRRRTQCRVLFVLFPDLDRGWRCCGLVRVARLGKQIFCVFVQLRDRDLPGEEAESRWIEVDEDANL